MIALIIQIIVFVAYMTFISIKFGVIHSISESWYKLPKGQKAWFTAFCWGLGFPMVVHEHGLFMLSAAGFLFVGAATMFKQRMTDKVHYAGAGAGIVGALAGLWVVYGAWWPLMVTAVALGGILVTKIKHPIYWLEIVAAITIIAGLLAVV
jgi:hypothetical protein